MRRYITELIGTLFLVMGAILGGGVGASLALIIMVYAGGHISGAHYNPAITLSVLIRGKIGAKEVIPYWISQIAGAFIAALIVGYVFDVKSGGDCVIPDDGILKAFAAEFLGTFALAYVVLNAAFAKATSGNSYYGLAIGGTVLAMALVIGRYSGGAYNPAVAAGLSLQGSFCWTHIWLYIVAGLGGAALAAVIFRLNNPDDL